jgi:hypothetical protein
VHVAEHPDLRVVMITFLVLLRAAKRLEPLYAGLARETYLEALSAAAYAARFVTGGVLRQTAAPGDPRLPGRDWPVV